MNLRSERQSGWSSDAGGGPVCPIFRVFLCPLSRFDRACDATETCYQYIDCRLMCILLSIAWIGVSHTDAAFVDFQVTLRSALVEPELLSPVSKDESALKKLHQLVEDVSSADEGRARVQRVLGYAKKIPRLPADAKVPENRVMGCTSQVVPIPFPKYHVMQRGLSELFTLPNSFLVN